METPRRPDRCAPHPLLETFLVEWKQGQPEDRAAVAWALETFLVEWKQNVLHQDAFTPRFLETFLVEWKPMPETTETMTFEPLKPS